MPSTGIPVQGPGDVSQPEAVPPVELASRDFQTAVGRMMASAATRRATASAALVRPTGVAAAGFAGTAAGGAAAGLAPQSPTLTDSQREAKIGLLAAEYQCAMERLQEEAAVLGTASTAPVPPDLELVLDKLRKQQAGLVAELHKMRLERQNLAIQGELETERLLAQLQEAQLRERHQQLRGELQRTGQGHQEESTSGLTEIVVRTRFDEDDKMPQESADACPGELPYTSTSDSKATPAPAKKRPSNLSGKVALPESCLAAGWKRDNLEATVRTSAGRPCPS